MGKTYSALSYCTDNKDSLYFSFRHISAELALKAFAERYPDVFKDCTTWAEFFDCLQIYGKEKRPNSYVALWYKTLLTATPSADGSFGEDVFDRFMRYLTMISFLLFTKKCVPIG